jgi:TIGR03009 family protein
MHSILLSLVLAAGSPGGVDDLWIPQIGFLLNSEKTPSVPFRLTSEEEINLNKVLTDWEKAGRKIKTFDCKFRRWEYFPALARSKATEDEPVHIDLGIIKFAAPDKGKYQVDSTFQFLPDGAEKEAPIEENRAERYLCDGKSAFIYDPVKKCRHEHQLPPELCGKPLESFLFPHFYILAIDAKKMRERFYLRLVTPKNTKDLVWIEAFPRTGRDAARFQHLVIALEEGAMRPYALKVVMPGGRNWSSYKFYDVAINDPSQKSPDAFQADTPKGWEKEVHPAQTAPKPPKKKAP